MNDFLSDALSFANAAIFCIVSLGAVINIYEGNIEFFKGLLVVFGAAVICGFVATLMVIKEYIISINSQIGGTNNITEAIYNKIQEKD